MPISPSVRIRIAWLLLLAALLGTGWLLGAVLMPFLLALTVAYALHPAVERMPLYTTVTGFAVTPVVALVDARARWRLQQSEVAEVFEVPLEFLMDPRHHELRGWDSPEAAAAVPGAGPGRRVFFAMPWQDAHSGRSYFIWGATAAMIRNLYRLLIA